MRDLKVYTFYQRPSDASYRGEILLLDGKQLGFSNREKALALKKTGRTKGFRLALVSMCQSVCIPAIVDPKPKDFERIQRVNRFS